MTAKNASGLIAHWRSLVGEFRWPLGGGLLLIFFFSALAWLRTPSYASLRPTRFDLMSAGIIADYGRIRLGQRLSLEFRAPDDFPVDRILEVLFRIGGMSAADAAALRKRYRDRPADFLLVAPRYRINPREVQVASGTAVLLRYLPDDAVERLTLVWTARDRAYFLSGAPLTQVEAMAIANSLN